RHNLIYWQAGEYLGLGTGAVSFRDGQRWKNRETVSGLPDESDSGMIDIEILESMNQHDRFVDAVILGLRLTQGISRQQFIERFGIDFAQEYHAILEKFRRDGLLIMEQDRLYLSRRGYFLSNQFMAELL
ncbi:MAG: hypothetical protein GX642_14620, partial [Smithella sp.]|nr:hypothetical protein [Smithella sp.]